ncbi:MAG TPA: hypothetical protein VKT76_06145 [Bradyrhizobium sp.]|nr:hypothetical protein [Bradyrhizobium sp.]
MESFRRRNLQATLSSLEAAAISARGGFACMFWTAEEYETALIVERRAQGRYNSRYSRWPIAMFVGCAVMVAGTVLLLS